MADWKKTATVAWVHSLPSQKHLVFIVVPHRDEGIGAGRITAWHDEKFFHHQQSLLIVAAVPVVQADCA
jgi:hypothetical protein